MDYPIKLWLSLGRCIAFTENDNRLFRVWPTSEYYTKNKSVDLMPKFIQATNLNAARYQAHKFVDDMFNSFVKNDETSTVYPKPVPPPVDTFGLSDSLTIENDVPAPPTSANKDLLDLNNLV